MRVIKEIAHSFLDLLYPNTCAVCGKRLEFNVEILICENCIQSLPFIRRPFCRICGRLLAVYEDDMCPRCRINSFHFSHSYAVFTYTGVIKELIHKYKYNSCTYLVKTFVNFMYNYFQKYIAPVRIDVIISVPLHKTRLRQRGYNQAQLLAERLAEKLQLEYSDVLQRKKDTVSQIELPRERRITNVRNAFVLYDNSKVNRKRILLIDDVFTTGATLNECSKVLKENGAKDIKCFCLARGE